MLAIYADKDKLYGNPLTSAFKSVAAGVLFTAQIYCDFSAYSEIARGTPTATLSYRQTAGK